MFPHRATYYTKLPALFVFTTLFHPVLHCTSRPYQSVTHMFTLLFVLQVVQYMQLERLVLSGPALAPALGPSTAADRDDLSVGNACSDAARPPGSPPQQQQQQRECHVHKYSVVWHAIYRVPVLYISASRTGADTCMLRCAQAVRAQCRLTGTMTASQTALLMASQLWLTCLNCTADFVECADTANVVAFMHVSVTAYVVPMCCRWMSPGTA
jgi:hypothetical protein